jgi:putative transposase
MKALQCQYRTSDLCAAFNVSRSGFHRWRTAGPCQRVGEDARIGELLCEVHRQSQGTYGRPRLVAALRQRGYRCSPKRIARLMRLFKLRGVQRGRFRPQTTQSAQRTPAPNLLLKREAASVPGQVWVADITFISTKQGWLYLAGIMDQGSRRILGMAFGSRLDASLCLAALRQAFGAQPRQRQRLIHHSDQGYQYASGSYRQLLREKQIHQSMSRKANCYDNAHIESFWATLKTEGLPRKSYATRAEARLAIFSYVHTFYNRVRLHSALGYKSPVDFEQQTH